MMMMMMIVVVDRGGVDEYGDDDAREVKEGAEIVIEKRRAE